MTDLGLTRRAVMAGACAATVAAPALPRQTTAAAQADALRGWPAPEGYDPAEHYRLLEALCEADKRLQARPADPQSRAVFELIQDRAVAASWGDPPPEVFP